MPRNSKIDGSGFLFFLCNSVSKFLCLQKRISGTLGTVFPEGVKFKAEECRLSRPSRGKCANPVPSVPNHLFLCLNRSLSQTVPSFFHYLRKSLPVKGSKSGTAGLHVGYKLCKASGYRFHLGQVNIQIFRCFSYQSIVSFKNLLVNYTTVLSELQWLIDEGRLSYGKLE
jgi:hypothetical protein